MRNFFWIVTGVFLLASPSLVKSQRGSEDLISAVRSGNTPGVLVALKEGADVNKLDKDGNTALIFSMYYGYAKMEIVGALLQYGANVNAQNTDGMTALMFAANGKAGTAQDFGPEFCLRQCRDGAGCGGVHEPCGPTIAMCPTWHETRLTLRVERSAGARPLTAIVRRIRTNT